MSCLEGWKRLFAAWRVGLWEAQAVGELVRQRLFCRARAAARQSVTAWNSSRRRSDATRQRVASSGKLRSPNFALRLVQSTLS